VGKLLKDNGIQLLYHNHDFEFNKYDGKFLLDWLYESVPEDLLKTQIDTCWVRYAGHDPAEYIKKYAGRAPLVHLKDFTCKTFGTGPAYDLIDAKDVPEKTENADNGFEFLPLGQGLLDVPAILAAAENAGTECVVVETDEPGAGLTPIEFVKAGREYLKSLGL
jgi:sugar phosphate isomerase/epimerase